MTEKTISSDKKLTKLDAPPVPKKCGDTEDVKSTNSKPNRRAKVRRKVKLPRLKLGDLVAQVTEENTHEEISTGSAVGNEIW